MRKLSIICRISRIMTEHLRILIPISNYLRKLEMMEKTLSDKIEPKNIMLTFWRTLKKRVRGESYTKSYIIAAQGCLKMAPQQESQASPNVFLLAGPYCRDTYHGYTCVCVIECTISTHKRSTLPAPPLSTPPYLPLIKCRKFCEIDSPRVTGVILLVSLWCYKNTPPCRLPSCNARRGSSPASTSSKRFARTKQIPTIVSPSFSEITSLLYLVLLVLFVDEYKFRS